LFDADGVGRTDAALFFHMALGPVYIHDYHGSDPRDEGAARRRAIEDIGAVWKSSTIRKRNPVDCAVVVSDDERELFPVPFVEAPGALPGMN
jgi:hypothetical protein